MGSPTRLCDCFLLLSKGHARANPRPARSRSEPMREPSLHVFETHHLSPAGRAGTGYTFGIFMHRFLLRASSIGKHVENTIAKVELAQCTVEQPFRIMST